MIGEDLQKFSRSRVMRTIAIGRVPIRNLPKSQLSHFLLTNFGRFQIIGLLFTTPFPNDATDLVAHGLVLEKNNEQSLTHFSKRFPITVLDYFIVSI
ncbi:hypothetical protein AVEN_264552-1 [Araneus ventricosus]|uniref:Uncharacterized protein n=1 Tax=Araneus ventricosus TaxID=182803 RepID=A0A4Y2KX62_ARAVE|nr:hypothetical protein AVEN_264552-1 [Araneus ventricosus]